MVFSSLIFVFVFLPVVLLVYSVSKEKYRNAILLLASVIFYAYGEPQLVFLMLFSILVNFLLALGIERYAARKPLFVLAAAYNLAVLFVFKYLGFSVDILNTLFGGKLSAVEIALPIGISFYTFQSISYVADVYMGRVKAQRNILNLGLYISLFPQLIAGPIVRYNSIERQLENRSMRYDVFAGGGKAVRMRLH